VNGGRNENCVVYREDGTVEPGACYLSDKGEEDVFEPRVPLASHNMVANVLEDKHSPDQIIGPLWKTAISDPVVAFDFTNPAKGQSLIFTNVMQMMRNRCEFHNALNSVTQLESSVKPAEAPDSGNFTVHNGTENIQVAMKEVRDRGFCASQQPILQAHRVALSQPGLYRFHFKKSEKMRNRYILCGAKSPKGFTNTHSSKQSLQTF